LAGMLFHPGRIAAEPIGGHAVRARPRLLALQFGPLTLPG
jgi:hypothetical protein